MIQIHGKTILSMEFKSIIKAHGLYPWQFIHPKAQFSLATFKAQFSLAISKPSSRWQYLKPNSRWQHKSPILIGNI